MNELQFLYEEMDLISDLCGTASADFESHYRVFCAENDIDLKKLNQDNSDQLKEVYGVKDLEEDEVPSELPYSGSAELTFWEGRNQMMNNSLLTMTLYTKIYTRCLIRSLKSWR